MKLSYIVGMGLIEFLVGQCIFLVILINVFYLYQSIAESYRYQHTIARLHEDARIAFQVMSSEIREAGFIGCPRLSQTLPLKNTTRFLLSEKNILEGSSDHLTVRKTIEPFVTLTGISGKSVWLSHAFPWKVGDTVILSDCTQAEVHTIEKIFVSSHENLITLDSPVTMNFKAGTFVAEMNAHQFYLVKNKLSKGLFVKEVFHPQDTSEIIDDVENLQINYGFLNHGQLQFLTAASINDWQKIMAVHITLTLLSLDPMVRNTWDDVIWLRERSLPQEIS